MSSSSTTWSPQDLPAELRTALDAALDKKALAPAVLRVTELAGYTDWVMILSARSERQVAAIAEAIVRTLKSHGRRPRGTDGFEGHQWDLLDYDDFIVHVFHHPVRVHFDLESMWSDAPRVELGLPAEVMDTSSLHDVFAAPTPPAALPEYHGDARFGGFDDEFEDDDFDDEAPEDQDDDQDDGQDDGQDDDQGDDQDDEWTSDVEADETEDVSPA